jgi:hypothetical protein
MNFNEIYEGWRNTLFPPSEIKEFIEKVSKERLEICKNCPFHSRGVGKDVKMYSRCLACGCPNIQKSKCLSCRCGIATYNEQHPESTEVIRWEAVASPEQNEELKTKLSKKDA